MSVMQARVERGDGEISVLITLDGEERTVHFTGLPDLPENDDFLLPLLLPPAMSIGADLQLPTVMCGETPERVARLQSIFRTWFDGFEEIALTTAFGSSRRPSASGHPTRSACFFSGGVDSFFSVLELQDELDAVIFVSGFDIGLGREHEPDEALILERLTAAAGELGLRVVHVKTDLRQWSEQFVGWEKHYYGSALAAVALLLGSTFDRVYHASSHTYRTLFPDGSHPLTDPLWSTPEVSVRLHGCDTTRLQKVARIAKSPVAMRTLRVCWENRSGAYNCGQCNKCGRTMAELWAVEALDRCDTLPNEITAAMLAGALRGDGEDRQVYADEIATAIERRRDPEARALREAAAAILREQTASGLF